MRQRDLPVLNRRAQATAYKLTTTFFDGPSPRLGPFFLTAPFAKGAVDKIFYL